MRLATALLLTTLLAAPGAVAQLMLASAELDAPAVAAALDAGDEGRPGAYTIYALYPNPTSDRSELTFSVEEAQDVRVALFDVLGRRVATLFEGELEAGVTRAVEVDVAQLPVGLYVVRIAGEDFRAVRRLTVVR